MKQDLRAGSFTKWNVAENELDIELVKTSQDMYGKIISKFPQFCQLKEENQKQDLNFLVYSSLSATIDLRTWSGPNIP